MPPNPFNLSIVNQMIVASTQLERRSVYRDLQGAAQYRDLQGATRASKCLFSITRARFVKDVQHYPQGRETTWP